eukprot:g74429.t1
MQLSQAKAAISPLFSSALDSKKGLLQAVVGQVGVTSAVWLYMYYKRIPVYVKDKERMGNMKTRTQFANAMPAAATAPSDNLQNLFEMPVLFYAATGLLIAAPDSLLKCDKVDVRLAQAFVLLRAGHSLVHCNLGDIPTRFALYLGSCAVLGGLWVRIGRQVFG